VKRQAEVEILPMAHANGLAVFPYSPLGGGLLTGKYAGKPPSRGRLVDVPMYATRYGDRRNHEVAASFVGLAAELGVHPVTLAVAWVADHPAVTAPLIGAGSLEQLEPALVAGSFRLDPELRARVCALSPEPPPATDRNEERSAHTYGAR
jgi:aryl-alcohol dehydrogenase-like predicted oxidoreductase